MNESLYQLLRKVDTPTVCNAIELIHGTRGFNNFTKKTIYIADLDLPPMVGFAKTARVRGTTPPTISQEEVRKIRMDYYKYMSEGPRPAICVVQDMDYPHAVGAYWGEINNRVHRAFGLSGTLTDGLMRDLDYLAAGYQVIAGDIGPSHAFVHVLDFDTVVEIFGMKVAPSDLVHADRHGAVVIPDDMIPVLEDGIHTLIGNENIILDAVRNTEALSFEEFEKIWNEFEKARI